MDPITGSVLGTVGGAIVGAAGSLFSGKQSADFAKESYKKRYQWQVKDMQKAGLNPMLAFSQGAPNVPQPNFPNIGEAAVKGGQAGFSAVQMAKVNEATIGNLNTSSAKNVAEANRATAEADAIRGVNTEEKMAHISYLQRQTEHVVEQINAARTENAQRSAMLSLQRDMLAASAEAARAGADMKSFIIALGKIGERVLQGIQSPSVQAEARSLVKDTLNLIDDKFTVGNTAYNAGKATREWIKKKWTDVKSDGGKGW